MSPGTAHLVSHTHCIGNSRDLIPLTLCSALSTLSTAPGGPGKQGLARGGRGPGEGGREEKRPAVMAGTTGI